MISMAFPPADRQLESPAAHCHYCGRGLYDNDPLYAVNGMVLCEGCLPAFAREEYTSFRMSGREWRTL